MTGAEQADAGTLAVSGRTVAAHDAGDGALAGNRRHLPAAVVVPASFRRREHRALARGRRRLAARPIGTRAGGGRSSAARGGRRRHRSGSPRRDAQHARAADGRDREGDRRTREDRHHGRANRVADGRTRSNGCSASSACCARRAAASSTSPIVSKKCSPSAIGLPCCATVRRWRRGDTSTIDRSDVDSDDGRSGAERRISEARRSRWGSARWSCGSCRIARWAFMTCR